MPNPSPSFIQIIAFRSYKDTVNTPDSPANSTAYLPVSVIPAPKVCLAVAEAAALVFATFEEEQA